ncbi:hypothetical protein IFM89_009153 [Coptis chinensis]|uniref:Srp40 C-terminal domain-containing protein n=1 Tax=Coptis chinensis TaxID=261450 RepID=A0A835LTW3_9MAGN|nr:hypothetical protein IFM89_009153 [Coptis chinensis]
MHKSHLVEKPATTPLFVPRQVTLSNRTMKQNKDTTTLKINKTNKNKSRDILPLLVSVAAFLEHQGFTQTLAAFHSEASIAQLDGSKILPLDLETYYNYLQTCKCDAKARELDGVANEYLGRSKHSSPVELSIKKKKKSSDSDAVIVDEQRGDLIEVTKLVNDSDDKSIKFQDKKKKSKLGSDSQLDKSDIVPNSQLDDSDKKPKDKKKKKSKSISVETDEQEYTKCSQNETETCPLVGKLAAESSSIEVARDEKDSKCKDKKKKKKKNKSKEDESDQVDFGKDESEKKDVPTLEDNVVSIDKKGSKKRKRIACEVDGSVLNVKTLSKEEKQAREVLEDDKKKENKLLDSDGHAGKKFKTENGQVDPKKSEEISIDKKLDVSTEFKKTPKGSDGQAKADLHASGDLEESGKEGSAPQKNANKQQSGSAEPKTHIPFQRVKIDEVEFADHRLQDNSYWAKGGADSGYGAKAQEVLGQVRGRYALTDT